jgi:hypothetical protein
MQTEAIQSVVIPLNGTSPMQWRRMFQFRLLTLFVTVAVLCFLIAANARPHSFRLLGHVTSDVPTIRPGLWISGEDYGWPWPYKTESFKTEAIQITVFDQFYWLGFVGNLAVGLVILGCTGTRSEIILRFLSSRHRTNARVTCNNKCASGSDSEVAR